MSTSNNKTAHWWKSTGINARLKWWLRDAENILRYGSNAPRFGELIYVPTTACTTALKPYVGNRRYSGRITKPTWIPQVQPVEDERKVQICLRHWRDGMSWQQAGAYENAARKIEQKGCADWCKTPEQVISRYENLDRVLEVVKSEGRLRAIGRKGIKGSRVLDGILIHLDSDGTPIAGGGGWHRLSMALALNLPHFPAQIGMVHPHAIAKLWKYRCNPGRASGCPEAGDLAKKP